LLQIYIDNDIVLEVNTHYVIEITLWIK